MSQLRLRRIESLLKEEISLMIVNDELKDPRIDKLLSITDVSVSKDLEYARVYVSHYNGKETLEAAVEALNHAAGFIQRILGRELELRTVPHLRFFHDESIERGYRITQKLKELTS